MTEQELYKNIAQNLSYYRLLNGFTQAEIAECINYSNKSISKWEQGGGVPDIYVLMSLSDIYGITVSELIGQTERSKKTNEKAKAAEKEDKATRKAKKKALDRVKKIKRREQKEKK